MANMNSYKSSFSCEAKYLTGCCSLENGETNLVSSVSKIDVLCVEVLSRVILKGRVYLFVLVQCFLETHGLSLA